MKPYVLYKVHSLYRLIALSQNKRAATDLRRRTRLSTMSPLPMVNNKTAIKEKYYAVKYRKF